MKKYILGMIMAVFAFIAILPIQAFAADTAPGVECKHSEDGTVSVELKNIPDVSADKVSTFRLKLKVSSGTLGDDGGLADPVMVFSDAVTQRAKVYETRYNKEQNILNIYVSGTDPVFETDGNLLVGALSVSDGNHNVDIKVNLADGEDAFEVVRNGNAVNVSLVDNTKEDQGGSEEGPDEGDDEKPGQAGFDPQDSTGNNSTDTAKDKYNQNRKLNGTKLQGVKTGDTSPLLLCVAAITVSLAVIAAIAYRKRRTRR